MELLHERMGCGGGRAVRGALTLGIVLALLLGMAASVDGAGAALQDFRFFAERREAAVVVRVEYDHALLGWVEAGQVAFQDAGAVVLTIRGEAPRVVSNLSQALSAVIQRQGADAMLGRQLAQRIEHYRALP